MKRARSDAADVVDAALVFLYRDSSIAPPPDMRRRLKAVMDVLGAFIRYACRSFIGRLNLLLSGTRFGLLVLCIMSLLMISMWIRGLGTGEFDQVVFGVHHRLSDFSHSACSPPPG